MMPSMWLCLLPIVATQFDKLSINAIVFKIHEKSPFYDFFRKESSFNRDHDVASCIPLIEALSYFLLKEGNDCLSYCRFVSCSLRA
mmetsp:Transcript_12248/g.22959  ORF Transcript_12248/g.22959 Transcript_12248/m.22959 type:complete len:86 (+) Transcript_12248:175-432(+)